MAKLTFWFEGGALIRGAARRVVETYCFERGLTCTIREDKALLSSRYFVTIEDEDSAAIVAAGRDLEEWAKRMATA